MIVQIDSDNRKSFFGLAPKEELLLVDADMDQYGFGYVDSPASPPLGALVFSTEFEESGENEDEEALVLVIKSFFVLEEYRLQNIAVILFANLLDLAKELKAKAIRADIPLGRDYDGLCDVLSEFGFEFFMTELFEVKKPVSDFLKRPVFINRRKVSSIPLRNMSQGDLNYCFQNICSKKEILKRELPTDKNAYDKDLSLILSSNNIPSGLFLVRLLPNGVIEPVLLKLSKDTSPKAAIDMLSSSLNEAVKKGLIANPVHIKCGSRGSANMIHYFFPNLRAITVRRGYLYL